MSVAKWKHCDFLFSWNYALQSADNKCKKMHALYSVYLPSIAPDITPGLFLVYCPPIGVGPGGGIGGGKKQYLNHGYRPGGNGGYGPNGGYR